MKHLEHIRRYDDQWVQTHYKHINIVTEGGIAVVLEHYWHVITPASKYT